MFNRAKNIILLTTVDLFEPKVWQGLFWNVSNLIAFQIETFYIAYAPQKIINETENIKKVVIDLCERTSHNSTDRKRVIKQVHCEILIQCLFVPVGVVSFTVNAYQSKSLYFTNV